MRWEQWPLETRNVGYSGQRNELMTQWEGDSEFPAHHRTHITTVLISDKKKVRLVEGRGRSRQLTSRTPASQWRGCTWESLSFEHVTITKEKQTLNLSSDHCFEPWDDTLSPSCWLGKPPVCSQSLHSSSHCESQNFICSLHIEGILRLSDDGSFLSFPIFSSLNGY